MDPFYETLVANKIFDLDQKALDSMRAKIDEELKKLDEKIADAEENLGESEVREAHLAKSLFYIRIGDKEKALQQLKLTENKTVAVGKKMDLVFYMLQIGFFHKDFDLISKSIDKALLVSLHATIGKNMDLVFYTLQLGKKWTCSKGLLREIVPLEG